MQRLLSIRYATVDINWAWSRHTFLAMDIAPKPYAYSIYIYIYAYEKHQYVTPKAQGIAVAFAFYFAGLEAAPPKTNT